MSQTRKEAEQGVFISFEGVDGAGKTSHIHRTAELLKSRGREVIVTREPGGTPLSEKIRDIVIHDSMYSKTEALLMYASRFQHVHEVVVPALERGACVISDRFEDSSFAYQGSAGGVDNLGALSQWVLQGFKPDLTLLFDLPIELSLERIAGRREAGDKFEAQPRRYLEQVRAGFIERSNEEPQRIRVIDSSVDEQAVWQQVEHHLIQFLEGVVAPDAQ